MFSPYNISKTKLTSQEISYYILDKNKGLGRFYNFNSNCEYAFSRKVKELKTQDLYSVIRLLTIPNPNRERFIEGWKDLGVENFKLRIVIRPKKFGKDEVCFLFLNNDRQHQAYLDIVKQIPVDKFQFKSN